MRLTQELDKEEMEEARRRRQEFEANDTEMCAAQEALQLTLSACFSRMTHAKYAYISQAGNAGGAEKFARACCSAEHKECNACVRAANKQHMGLG